MDTRGGPQPFTIEVDEQDGTTIVRLAGELDMASSPVLAEALGNARTAEVIVDLRRLTFLDSTGLGVLLAADLRSREGDMALSFVPGIESVQRVFQITEIDRRVRWIDPPD